MSLRTHLSPFHHYPELAMLTPTAVDGALLPLTEMCRNPSASNSASNYPNSLFLNSLSHVLADRLDRGLRREKSHTSTGSIEAHSVLQPGSVPRSQATISCRSRSTIQRFKDLPTALHAEWLVRAASSLIDWRQAYLLTILLADEEVEKNNRKGRHVGHLLGEIRESIFRTPFAGLPEPTYLSAIEVHHTPVTSKYPVNTRYRLHAHMVIEIPPHRLPIFDEAGLRYCRRAHGHFASANGYPKPTICNRRGAGGAPAGLCLKLPRGTVTLNHLTLDRSGLAANRTPIDPLREFRAAGLFGLEGALAYCIKNLDRLHLDLRLVGLRDGFDATGRKQRTQPIWASENIRQLAKQLHAGKAAMLH